LERPESSSKPSAAKVFDFRISNLISKGVVDYG
jgi:hypothetical protein